MDSNGRDDALASLEVLVGEWRMEATFPSHSDTSEGPIDSVGRSVFEWALDRQYLVQRSDAPPPAPDSLAVVSVNPDGETYSQHYFDSRGVTRVYAMTLTDGVWCLAREAPDFSPLDFSQRFTGTISDDGRTISGHWEISTDGTEWDHDFALTYTKVT
jgi:hypothetical protein